MMQSQAGQAGPGRQGRAGQGQGRAGPGPGQGRFPFIQEKTVPTFGWRLNSALGNWPGGLDGYGGWTGFGGCRENWGDRS